MGKAFVLVAASIVALSSPTLATDEELEGIKKWFESYDAALTSKDLKRLAPFYHPDVTIFEGGGINRGWIDYRDKHLGPELKDFQSLEFVHLDVMPHLLGSDGKTAYVTAEYRLKARTQSRGEVEAGGLATLVLVKDNSGAWQIRHSHTSSRRPSALVSPAPPRR